MSLKIDRGGQPNSRPLGRANLTMRCQTSTESGFARALTARHPSRRSEAGLQGIRLAEISVACEEAREGESAGSPGVQYVTPEWEPSLWEPS